MVATVGGVRDEGDPDSRTTALRGVVEETGLQDLLRVEPQGAGADKSQPQAPLPHAFFKFGETASADLWVALLAGAGSFLPPGHKRDDMDIARWVPVNSVGNLRGPVRLMPDLANIVQGGISAVFDKVLCAPSPSRRAVLGGLLAATANPVMCMAAAEGRSGEESLPLGAKLLRVAEVTTEFEDQMLENANLDPKKLEEMGAMVLGRDTMVSSIEVLLRNTGITSIYEATGAVEQLRKVQQIARDGKEPEITKEEFGEMAAAYRAAREELQSAFDRLPKKDQDAAKAAIKRLDAADKARLSGS